MFGKLLKHELKSSAPIMLILIGIIFGFGVTGAVGLRLLTSGIEAIVFDPSTAWLLLPGIILFYAAYIGIIVCVAASQYIQLFRFYGSRFTDRGYLTFTLPVSVHSNFLSATLNMLIWFVITYGVFLFALFAMFFGGLSGLEDFTLDSFLYGMQYAWQDMPPAVGLAILFILFVSPVYTVVLNMTAVVTACSIFKRMKILGIIGFLYVFSMIFSVVIGAIMMMCTIPAAVAGNDPMPMMAIAYGAVGVIMVLVSVGGYFLSTYLMKKKLNLA